MPIAYVRLNPGVNVELTPALNQTGFTAAAYVRWREGLPEQLGGWEAWYSSSMGSQVRALHAWKDLNEDERLAVGSEASLKIILDDGAGTQTLTTLTPEQTSTSIAISLDTTNGSPTVTIDWTSHGLTTYDSIEIQTPVIVGGLKLYGTYRVASVLSADAITITAASNATSTVANGGAVPRFDTTIGQAIVTVTWATHGYSVGDTFPALASTTASGIVIQGLYTVQTVPTVNTFTIACASQATATASTFMNGNQLKLLAYISRGPQGTTSGYGIGGYGSGGYGTGSGISGSSGTPITTTDWTLDNWGAVLLASPVGDGIYYWSGDSNLGVASLITEAPNRNTGMLVAMPQQQVIAYGASVLGVRDPLLVAWCDVGDFTTWNAQTINQAGTYRIPRGSEIVGARQASQQTLLWTDLDLWAMQYIGPPEVYGFNQIGSGCGLIAKHAHASLGSAVAWMGQSSFYVYNGGVQPLDCPVWDVVYQNLNRDYVSNIRAGSNTRFNELWWFYPSLASTDGECDSYVKVNILTQAWDFGPMGRSAWIDQSVLGAPIAAHDGTLYQHEQGYSGNGGSIGSSVRTGFFMLDEGGAKVFVDLVWPDFKFQTYGDPATEASLQVTFLVRDYPEDTPRSYGPYTITPTTQWINTRMRGRMIALQIDNQTVGGFWRLGNLRYRYAPDGSR